MANCTFGFITSVDSYSDFAAQSMRLTLSGLPSLATVKVYATVTALSGTQTTYLITSTGTTTFPSAKGVTLKIEPLYNDGYAAGSLVGSIQALTSGGSVLGSASVNHSIAAVHNVNYVKDDVGTAGADFLSGDLNANDLIGLEGNDMLAGGLGADSLDGGDGTDTASYADIAAAVSVNLNIGQGFGNHAQGDTYSGIENVIGSSQADFIIGDSGANRLDGADGDDLLVGSVGADVLVGGNGTDTASYGDNWGAVFVNLTIGQGFGNQAQGDTYSGIENLDGGLFDDFFIGDGGANRLDGGAGADTLVGAGGADSFLFDTALGGANVDTIADFTAIDDTILLDDAVFAGLALGALAAGAFVVGTAAADGDDRIVYNQATGALLFDADGAGGVAAIQFATLSTNLLTLSASDFAVI